MNLTPGERHMVVAALTAMATQYRREAASRRWYGPRWSRVRAEAREVAAAYETLAEQVRIGGTIGYAGGTQHPQEGT